MGAKSPFHRILKFLLWGSQRCCGGMSVSNIFTVILKSELFVGITLVAVSKVFSPKSIPNPPISSVPFMDFQPPPSRVINSFWKQASMLAPTEMFVCTNDFESTQKDTVPGVRSIKNRVGTITVTSWRTDGSALAIGGIEVNPGHPGWGAADRQPTRQVKATSASGDVVVVMSVVSVKAGFIGAYSIAAMRTVQVDFSAEAFRKLAALPVQFRRLRSNCGGGGAGIMSGITGAV